MPETDSLADIVVTARKREERLLDVPLAVSLFDRAAIGRDRIDSVSDLIQRVPGATFTNTGPRITNEIMIRGVGSGRGINAEAAVGMYRNGFYSIGGNLGGRTLGRMDFFDVERIEVLRGPQGGLFGRNAVGGAINVITVQPQGETGGSAQLLAASNQRFEGEAILNLAASEAVSARFGLLGIRQSGGDFRNIDGAVLDRETFAGGRATVAVRPTDSLSLTLSVEHLDEDGPSFSTFAYNQLAPPDQRFRRRMNTPSRFARHETFVTLRIEADLGAASLSSGTMVKRRRASTDDDLDSWVGLSIPPLSSWRRQSSDQFRRFGQDFRLSGTADGPVSWMVGGEVLTLDSSFDARISGAAPPLLSLNNRNRTSSNDRSIAVYATIGVQLAPELNLAAELRSTWDRKSIDIESNLFSPTGVQTDRFFSFDRTFQKTSPVATLTWTPAADASLYLRYATGFRAGGFNTEPDPLVPERYAIAYQPESTAGFEAGARLLALDRRLRFAAALYRLETDDLLVPIDYSVTAGGVTREISVLENVGRSRQSGLEFEADAGIIRGARGGTLDLQLALSHGSGRIRAGQFAGQPVPRLRDLTLAAGATWRQPLSPDLALTAGASLRGEYGGLQDTDAIPLDDIQFLDLQLGLEGRGWRLTGAIENAADQLFDGDRNIPDAATGLFRQTYTTRPRQFSLRGRVEF